MRGATISLGDGDSSSDEESEPVAPAPCLKRKHNEDPSDASDDEADSLPLSVRKERLQRRLLP